jgi:mutator protein MutT
LIRRQYPDAPVVAVGAVVIEADSVLLVRRAHEPLKGEWSLPGGALELGETLEEGVVREVQEETGLQVQPSGIVEVFDRITYDEQTGRVRYHYVLVDYLCKVLGGNLCCASDALEARWVSREEISSLGVHAPAPFTAAVIEKAFAMIG